MIRCSFYLCYVTSSKAVTCFLKPIHRMRDISLHQLGSYVLVIITLKFNFCINQEFLLLGYVLSHV